MTARRHRFLVDNADGSEPFELTATELPPLPVLKVGSILRRVSDGRKVRVKTIWRKKKDERANDDTW
jgi:hypothetical protein